MTLEGYLLEFCRKIFVNPIRNYAKMVCVCLEIPEMGVCSLVIICVYFVMLHESEKK
jgi:hypothetical protein